MAFPMSVVTFSSSGKRKHTSLIGSSWRLVREQTDSLSVGIGGKSISTDPPPARQRYREVEGLPFDNPVHRRHREKRYHPYLMNGSTKSLHPTAKQSYIKLILAYQLSNGGGCDDNDSDRWWWSCL